MLDAVESLSASQMIASSLTCSFEESFNTWLSPRYIHPSFTASLPRSHNFRSPVFLHLHPFLQFLGPFHKFNERCFFFTNAASSSFHHQVHFCLAILRLSPHTSTSSSIKTIIQIPSYTYLFNIPRFISHQNSSRLHTFISFRDIPSQFLKFHLKFTGTIRRNGYKVSPSKRKVKICLLYRILIFYFWKVPSNVVHKTLDTEEPLFADCLKIDEGHSSMDNLDCSVEVNRTSFAATSARFECPEETNWVLILHNTQVSPIRTPTLRVCNSAFYKHDQLITGSLQ